MRLGRSKRMGNARDEVIAALEAGCSTTDHILARLANKRIRALYTQVFAVLRVLEREGFVRSVRRDEETLFYLKS